MLPVTNLNNLIVAARLEWKQASFRTLDSKQPPTFSTLCNVYELSPRVSEHAPSRGLNPGLPSLHREPKHRPALSTPTSGGTLSPVYQRMVGPCALWKTDSIIVIFNGHARVVLIVMKEQNRTLNHHITIRTRKNRIIKTLYITFYSNL
jgi:hypothetical protein